MTQYTTQDVWGFAFILAAIVTDNDSDDSVNPFMQKVVAAAKERGVTRFDEPSDALDQCRDICFDEAAVEMKLHWMLRNDVLYLIDLRLLGLDSVIEELDRQAASN